MPRYRRDHLANGAQYMSALKIMKAQNLPTIAQESPHYNLITIRLGSEIIFEVFHPM